VNAHLKSTLSVLPARRQSITAAASYELQRRFEANGAEAIAVVAHPSGANTNLQDEIGEMVRQTPCSTCEENDAKCRNGNAAHHPRSRRSQRQEWSILFPRARVTMNGAAGVL